MFPILHFIFVMKDLDILGGLGGGLGGGSGGIALGLGLAEDLVTPVGERVLDLARQNGKCFLHKCQMAQI